MKKKTANSNGQYGHLTQILTVAKPVLMSCLPDLQDYWQQLYLAIHQPHFKIVIAGTIGRGKSTVINRLLEKELLPTGGFPAASLSTRISYGPREQLIRIQPEQSREAPCTWDELAEAGQAGDVAIFARLKTPHPWLRQYNCTLCDTFPLEQDATAVRNLLQGCDALLLTISATMALSRTELDFIEHELLPLRLPRMAVLVSRLDQLPVADRETVVRYILKTFENLHWDIPVFLISDDGTQSATAFASLCGLAPFRQTLESWMTHGEHARLRYASLCAQVRLLLGKLAVALANHIEKILSAARAVRQDADEAGAEITQLRLCWEEMRLEMEKRHLTSERHFSDLLNQGRKDLAEETRLAVARATPSKDYAEKELPATLERQIKQLIRATVATIEQQMSADGLWLKEQVASAFFRDVRADRPQFPQDVPAKPGSPVYEDLQRSRRLSRMASGLGTVGAYLLAGPLGVVISIGGGLFSEAVLAGKIERQREQLAQNIQNELFRVFDEAIRTGTELIASYYRNASLASVEEESAWLQVQQEYLRQQHAGPLAQTAELESSLRQIRQLITDLNKKNPIS